MVDVVSLRCAKCYSLVYLRLALFPKVSCIWSDFKDSTTVQQFIQLLKYQETQIIKWLVSYLGKSFEFRDECVRLYNISCDLNNCYFYVVMSNIASCV